MLVQAEPVFGSKYFHVAKDTLQPSSAQDTDDLALDIGMLDGTVLSAVMRIDAVVAQYENAAVRNAKWIIIVFARICREHDLAVLAVQDILPESTYKAVLCICRLRQAAEIPEQKQ